MGYLLCTPKVVSLFAEDPLVFNKFISRKRNPLLPRFFNLFLYRVNARLYPFATRACRVYSV